MMIYPLEIDEKDNQLIAQSLVVCSGIEEKLWYSIDSKYRQYISHEKLDGVLVGLLPLAMCLGEDILIRGTISEKLYHNLTNYYINILRNAIPSLKPISLFPDSLDDGQIRGPQEGVGTGFTGGIDSFFTVYNYLLKDGVLPNYRITHFLFCNAGSHGPGPRGRELFDSRYELIKGFPEKLSISTVKIDSNLDGLLRRATDTTQRFRTLCLQSGYLSCSLLVQKLFKKYIFASSYRYQDSFTGQLEEDNDVSYLDPSIIHLLSTETLEYVLSGAEYSRVEKTKEVALSGIANRWLNVCTGSPHQTGGKNCSICNKCCRTLLTLELLGVVAQFADVFDLEKWESVRNRYVISNILRKSNDTFAKEIREYAKSIGYKFPPWQRIIAGMLNVKAVRKVIKACVRLIAAKDT